jgi:cbb3-type cytochrome oxidase cytochrome c subunit
LIEIKVGELLMNRNIFLYVCLALLTISTILLDVYIAIKNSDTSEHICETQNVIPDEETVRQIAYVIITTHSINEFGESWFDEVDRIGDSYMSTVRFYEETNEWGIVYLRLNPDGLHAMGGRRWTAGVHLCRDCGMVMGYTF